MAEPSRKLRCAIYTRKSTEDGLDQEFNSLDAQFEACRAYILSQRHEGWSLLNERYDDGGFSGGNLERPGLKQLLGDVASRKVDIIVIYKVDRLTRSLADFAKIVDVLDGVGASFVSITQSFNTTTSMGRLTLNMLLSFAQFEREVTSERIRDKIAASKRKGLWMGGPVPLGYEIQDRKLVVNEAEAETVRHIMRRYCELDSVRELVAELRRDGVVSKVQKRVSGPHRGGIPFARGALYHLLKNRIYLGEIVHKGSAYPGEHSPIVPVELWDRVQATLAERGTSTGAKARGARPSLLAGLVYDDLGRPMVPSHTTKGPRSYRYYVTRPDLVGHMPATRVAAHDVERAVRTTIAEFLDDREPVEKLIEAETLDVRQACRSFETAASLAATLREAPAAECIASIRQLLRKVTISGCEISVDLDRRGLILALYGDAADPHAGGEVIRLTSKAVSTRHRRELKLITPSAMEGEREVAWSDNKLIRLMADAYAARQLVDRSPDKPLSRIAAEEKRCRSHLTALIALSCLAPDVVTAIVEGRQPEPLNRRILMRALLPFDWERQRAALGLAPRST
jgi:DNA invertase Pin-like site-specific DNA recombinase